ncbi:hypothetical protein TPHA_0L00160 [Tetrapisispora phaffii CBS 4417]|uniref:Uncharacterized protein n=1 Tax=Tetrapisispora phaffii (strain ATCC 24235 / CBS 4417 / NBRC 1672 / NRRL Y-8282 / UCD 70-5) TaxID=1071381 RepID=G8BZP5_TETPH|nr:hypothetical protein TPHA_0L00160 [Tetrapisispora phaffii CBS 4417]CCE65373.1 hypothetical protein TPHA_0L00160 [Tetrapisispora phaffii CBS 4417]
MFFSWSGGVCLFRRRGWRVTEINIHQKTKFKERSLVSVVGGICIPSRSSVTRVSRADYCQSHIEKGKWTRMPFCNTLKWMVVYGFFKGGVVFSDLAHTFTCRHATDINLGNRITNSITGNMHSGENRTKNCRKHPARSKGAQTTPDSRTELADAEVGNGFPLPQLLLRSVIGSSGKSSASPATTRSRARISIGKQRYEMS